MLPILSVVAALALAHQCTPGAAPDTIVSTAKARSGLSALAAHDDMSGRVTHRIRMVPRSRSRRIGSLHSITMSISV
jgi:hypothetical protein